MKKIVRTIILGLMTIMFIVIDLILFNLIPNYVEGSAQYAFINAAVILFGLLTLVCFIVTVFSLFDDSY